MGLACIAVFNPLPCTNVGFSCASRKDVSQYQLVAIMWHAFVNTIVYFCFHLALNVYDPQGIEIKKYDLTNINILIFTAKKCQIHNVLNE